MHLPMVIISKNSVTRKYPDIRFGTTKYLPFVYYDLDLDDMTLSYICDAPLAIDNNHVKFHGRVTNH